MVVSHFIIVILMISIQKSAHPDGPTPIDHDRYSSISEKKGVFKV